MHLCGELMLFLPCLLLLSPRRSHAVCSPLILLSLFGAGAGPSSAAAAQEEDLMDDDTLKCAICMQLCERPVTVSF
jgi:hypothetical protein